MDSWGTLTEPFGIGVKSIDISVRRCSIRCHNIIVENSCEISAYLDRLDRILCPKSLILAVLLETLLLIRLTTALRRLLSK